MAHNTLLSGGGGRGRLALYLARATSQLAGNLSSFKAEHPLNLQWWFGSTVVQEHLHPVHVMCTDPKTACATEYKPYVYGGTGCSGVVSAVT